jgi:anti-anti-sigma factor
MTTPERTPSFTDGPEAPAHAGLRSGTVHRLNAYTTVRLTAHGPAPVTVFVTGDIDLACADELATLLRTTLDAHPQGMDLNLASVCFCDCRGLRALLTTQESARRDGRHFTLGPHSPIVARLLDLTNTRSVLTTAN